MGLPDFLLSDVADVLVHVLFGRLSARVDRHAGGLGRPGRGCAAASRGAARPACGRGHRRRGGGHRISAQYHGALSVHLVHGRFGIHGPRCIHHGPGDAQDRTTWQKFHSAGDGLRLQRTGHHGHTGNRKPLEPTDHNSDQPVYELLGKTADLRAANRNLFQPVCRICVSRALYGRSIRGRTYSKTAAAIRMEKGRDTFCHGTSAIPCAYTESNSQPHVEQSSTISQQNGRCDSGGMRDSMGAELFPAARERGQDTAKRTDRPVDRLIS